MWSDWVSNPGPLALESDALPTVLPTWPGSYVKAFYIYNAVLRCDFSIPQRDPTLMSKPSLPIMQL